MVICGAGGLHISCAKIYLALGLKKENIIMFDSKGPINIERTNLTAENKNSFLIIPQSKLYLMQSTVRMFLLVCQWQI